MKKRWLSILLVCGMLLTTLPSAVFAEGAEPSGCVCTAACTAEARNPECSTCGAEDAALEDCAKYEAKQENEPNDTQEPADPQEKAPEEPKATEPAEEPTAPAKSQVAVQAAANNKTAAVQAAHTHCACGGSISAGDHTSHSNVTYTAWNGTSDISYTNNTACVYLTGNATRSSHLTVDGKTLYLCLNGKTLSSNGSGKIQVKNGGHLVLCDCQGGGTFKGATKDVWGGACVYLYTSTFDMFGGKLTGGTVTGNGGGGAIALDDKNCVFNMYGGEISGNNGRNYGGAIFQNFAKNKPNATGGKFNMYGGTIKDNTAKNGGAFFSTTGGNIKMTGGTISGNTATQSSNDAGGGAIYMRGNGKIDISGSVQITGNSSSLDGGAILMGWGEINISGSAKINSNTASRWGGAICLRQDSNQSTMLYMRGGEISGNRANSEGGAVHVFDKDCQFFLYDGKITGNTSGDGGAIYLNQEPSWLIMQGGEISGNTATGNGGGVYIYRTGSVCQLYGGKIENNKASGNGGGIYINPSNSGQLRVGNKPLVQNNTVSGKANNVYLPSDKTLTIEIDMSKGASIGVTTANIRYPVAFSNSYQKDYANYFFADDANAYVEYKDDQRLYLVSDAPLVTYDVTVETEGGGTASASPETAVAGTEITLTAVPAPGYAFDHWEVIKGDVTITDNRFLMPAGAVTVKAVFTAKTFTVYYDPGDGSTPQSRSLGWNDYVLAGVSDPTRPGYTFLNWMYGSRPVADNDTYSGLVQSDAVASATLTAAWQLIPYTITYDLDGGTADGNPTGYSVESAAITLVNPTREGYDFTGWYLDAALTQPITSLTLEADTTVYAGWRKSAVPDMLNGDDHFAYVVGYADGTVRPDANISRAEVAAIFFRLLKPEIREDNLTGLSTFADVSEGMWYNKSVATMAKLGIVKGRPAGTFDPDEPITRGEFAAICARFDAGMTDGDSSFTDISGHWAEAEIERATSLGWIMGYTDGTFRPDNYITRAEAMTMINRVLCRIPEDEDDLLPGMNVWPDNQPGAWYYLAVQEATNSHDFQYKGEIYEHWIKLTTDPDWTRYQD